MAVEAREAVGAASRASKEQHPVDPSTPEVILTHKSTPVGTECAWHSGSPLLGAEVPAQWGE